MAESTPERQLQTQKYAVWGILISLLAIVIGLVYQAVDLQLKYQRLIQTIEDMTVVAGGINSPGWGTILDTRETAYGWISGTQPDKYIWLFVVAEGQESPGLVYPQERIRINGDRWHLENVGLGTTSETRAPTDAGKPFWILLGAVDRNADEMLEHERCIGVDSCEGLQDLPSVRWLDAVRVIKRADNRQQ